MGSQDRERRRQETLDRLAGVLEAVGFPHAIARVYAALTLAEGEGLSTSEIVEQLDVSKTSVSNAMQFLLGTRLAERYRVRGSREAHYRILKGVWGRVLSQKFLAISQILRSVEEALEFTESPSARERLEELHDVYTFFDDEFAEVMKRWEERERS